MLLDGAGQVAERYQVFALPVTVLVDRRGMVAGTVLGVRDWVAPDARAYLGELLTGAGAPESHDSGGAAGDRTGGSPPPGGGPGTGARVLLVIGALADALSPGLGAPPPDARAPAPLRAGASRPT